jgi:hypothetical protein
MDTSIFGCCYTGSPLRPNEYSSLRTQLRSSLVLLPLVTPSATPLGLRYSHIRASPYTAIHYAWVLLDPHDRYKATKTCTEWALYHQLCLQAVTTSLRPLRVTRAAPGNPTELPKDRSLLYGCALLLFDFLRWMGGEYTNRSKDWTKTFQTMFSKCLRPPPVNLPPADFERGYRICTEGVPLTGSFDSPFSALRSRDAYDNHLAIDSNLAKVQTKFAEEEERLFHIHLPRFLVYFISGLLLNPIQWAVRKGKGGICIDCTNCPDGAEATSSANTFIPSLPSERRTRVHPYTTPPHSCATYNIRGA